MIPAFTHHRQCISVHHHALAEDSQIVGGKALVAQQVIGPSFVGRGATDVVARVLQDISSTYHDSQEAVQRGTA